jgi:glucosylceramidase
MVNSHADARRVFVTQDRTRFQYTLPAQSVATFVWNPDQASRSAEAATRSSAGSPPVEGRPGAPATGGTVGERKVAE